MESINNVHAVSLYQVVSIFDEILMLFYLMQKKINSELSQTNLSK